MDAHLPARPVGLDMPDLFPVGDDGQPLGLRQCRAYQQGAGQQDKGGAQQGKHAGF